MKNKVYRNILYVLMGLYLLAPSIVYAKPAVSNEFKVVFARFSTGMIGVLVFSFLIYAGLALYTKFFVSKNIKSEELRTKSLDSPRDKDEAITKFIMKNRLK